MSFILLVVLSLLFVLAMLSGLAMLFSVSGTWERIPEAGDTDLGRERIVLAQMGPIVIGRRDLAGGYQSFFGYTFWGHLKLRRRDYGIRLLTRQGFPESIAKQLEGRVMLRFNLHLSSDKLFLQGVMIPYRVDFNHEPPEVTAMTALKALPRRYRRADLVQQQTQTAFDGAVVLK